MFDRLKVCVAGYTEFPRVGELVAALEAAGCHVARLAANVENVTPETGDAEWGRDLIMESQALMAEFEFQVNVVIECDVMVLVPPCSRSLHMLAGMAFASAAHLVVLLAFGPPELAYGLADTLCTSVDEVVQAVLAHAGEQVLEGSAGVADSEEPLTRGHDVSMNGMPAFFPPDPTTSCAVLDRQASGEATTFLGNA